MRWINFTRITHPLFRFSRHIHSRTMQPAAVSSQSLLQLRSASTLPVPSTALTPTTYPMSAITSRSQHRTISMLRHLAPSCAPGASTNITSAHHMPNSSMSSYRMHPSHWDIVTLAGGGNARSLSQIHMYHTAGGSASSAIRGSADQNSGHAAVPPGDGGGREVAIGDVSLKLPVVNPLTARPDLIPRGYQGT